MRHLGTMYLAKAKPIADKAADGTFQLTLALVDNQGENRKEGYRVRWEGPAAQAFWDAHRAELLPGAICRVELSHLRQHMGSAYPFAPELRARVVSLEICPKRSPAEREQLSNQEHSQPAAAAA